MRLRVLNFSAWSADESCDGTTVEPGALETCKQEKPFKAASLSRTRTQRIPSRPGALCSNEGRIHLRRPTCHPHFSLRQSGGPYIPVCRPTGSHPVTSTTWTLYG